MRVAGTLAAIEESSGSIAEAWWSDEIQDVLFDCTAALQEVIDEKRRRPDADPESLDLLVDAVQRMESAVAAREPIDYESAVLLLRFMQFNCDPTIRRVLNEDRVILCHNSTLSHIAAA
jgi:hypothetical protein